MLDNAENILSVWFEAVSLLLSFEADSLHNELSPLEKKLVTFLRKEIITGSMTVSGLYFPPLVENSGSAGGNISFSMRLISLMEYIKNSTSPDNASLVEFNQRKDLARIHISELLILISKVPWNNHLDNDTLLSVLSIFRRSESNDLSVLNMGFFIASSLLNYGHNVIDLDKFKLEAEKPWSSPSLRAFWLLICSTCLRNVTTMVIQFETFDSFLYEGINLDVFSFLSSSVDLFRDDPFVEEIVLILEAVIQILINNCYKLIRQLKIKDEDDYNRGLVDGHPKRFDEFLLFIAAVTKDRANAGLIFWKPKEQELFVLPENERQYSFLRWAAESKVPSTMTAFLILLNGLCYSGVDCQQVYEFLLGNSGPLSWKNLWSALENYLSLFKPAYSTSTHTQQSDMQMDPAESILIRNFLALTATLCSRNETIREIKFENNDRRAVSLLIGLLWCNINSDLKGVIFDVLSAVSMSSRIAQVVWQSVDTSGIMSQKSTELFGIRADLELVESRNGVYSSTTGMLKYVYTALSNVRSISTVFGSFSPYLEFIIEKIWKQLFSRQYQNQNDRWLIAELVLKIFIVVLEREDEVSDAISSFHFTVFILKEFLRYSKSSENIWILIATAYHASVENSMLWGNVENAIGLSLKFITILIKKEENTATFDQQIYGLVSIPALIVQKKNVCCIIAELPAWRPTLKIYDAVISFFKALTDTKKINTGVSSTFVRIVQGFGQPSSIIQGFNCLIQNDFTEFTRVLKSFLEWLAVGISVPLSAGPNMAHFLLGFDAMNLNQTNSDKFSESVLPNLITLSSYCGSSSDSQWESDRHDIAEKCSYVIWKLISSQLSSIVIPYLRGLTYFNDLIAEIEPLGRSGFPILLCWSHSGTNSVYLSTFKVLRQAWVLNSFAMEIHQRILHGHKSAAQSLISQLFTIDKSTGTSKIMSYLDGALSIYAPEVEVPSLHFFSDIDLSKFYQCETQYGREKSIYDISKLERTLYIRLHQFESRGIGLSPDQRSCAKSEIASIIKYSTFSNALVEWRSAQRSWSQAWARLFNISLFKGLESNSNSNSIEVPQLFEFVGFILGMLSPTDPSSQNNADHEMRYKFMVPSFIKVLVCLVSSIRKISSQSLLNELSGEVLNSMLPSAVNVVLLTDSSGLLSKDMKNDFILFLCHLSSMIKRESTKSIMRSTDSKWTHLVNFLVKEAVLNGVESSSTVAFSTATRILDFGLVEPEQLSNLWSRSNAIRSTLSSLQSNDSSLVKYFGGHQDHEMSIFLVESKLNFLTKFSSLSKRCAEMLLEGGILTIFSESEWIKRSAGGDLSNSAVGFTPSDAFVSLKTSLLRCLVSILKKCPSASKHWTRIHSFLVIHFDFILDPLKSFEDNQYSMLSTSPEDEIDLSSQMTSLQFLAAFFHNTPLSYDEHVQNAITRCRYSIFAFFVNFATCTFNRSSRLKDNLFLNFNSSLFQRLEINKCLISLCKFFKDSCFPNQIIIPNMAPVGDYESMPSNNISNNLPVGLLLWSLRWNLETMNFLTKSEVLVKNFNITESIPFIFKLSLYSFEELFVLLKELITTWATPETSLEPPQKIKLNTFLSKITKELSEALSGKNSNFLNFAKISFDEDFLFNLNQELSLLIKITQE